MGRKLLERYFELHEQILHILQARFQIIKVFMCMQRWKTSDLKTHDKSIIDLTMRHNHGLNHSTSWVQSTLQALMIHLKISNMIYWPEWSWCNIIIAIFLLDYSPRWSTLIHLSLEILPAWLINKRSVI